MKTIGVIAPYDFAQDRELWRWVGDHADLAITRTAPSRITEVGVAMAEYLSRLDVVKSACSALSFVEPDIVTYACASGSFVNHHSHERYMCEAMQDSGAPRALTATGALVRYLDEHQITHLSVVTPYPLDLAAKLSRYLWDAGKTVTQSSHFEMTGRIWETDPQRIIDAATGTLRGNEEAVYLACTNLPTYDIIVPLEEALGIPVISTNRVMISDALTQLGVLD